MLFLPQEVELITGILSFIFTIGLLSYLIGDNPFYRICLHTFIGVIVGYGTLVVMFQVVGPRIIEPILTGNPLVMGISLVPVVLFVLLFSKLNANTAVVGNVSIAYLVGVGSAVAVGGAIQGTLFPQVEAAWGLMGTSILSALVALILTVVALLGFQFFRAAPEEDTEEATAPEPRINIIFERVAGVGRGVVAVSLGAIYGGAILTGLTVFSNQLSSFSDLLTLILP